MTFGSGGLAGARVVVTRPEDRARALVAALDAEGAEVVLVPMLQAAPPEDPAPLLAAAAALAEAAEQGQGQGQRAGNPGGATASGRPSPFDLVSFTSVYAVRALTGALQEVLPGGAGTGAGAGWPAAACVGPSTTGAARAAGWRVEVVAERHSAAGLLAALDAWSGGPEGLAGLRVLYPRAADAREALARGLRRRGAEVREVVAYRKTVPSGRRFRPQPTDLLTFTSPSTVRNYFDRYGSAASRHACAAVIGPTTASAYRERAGREPVVARSASMEGLVEAAVEAWRGRS